MAIQDAHPDKRVELWGEDEARLGLQPVVRRVWAFKGQRPIANVCPAYQWLYVYGFVNPLTGESSLLLLPSVSIEWMNEALAIFAQEQNPRQDKMIVLLWDQAGFHTSTKLNIPEGIHLYPLPPYTPELQPAERLWPLMREAVANESHKKIETLENTLSERCQWLMNDQNTVAKLTRFQWIENLIINTT